VFEGKELANQFKKILKTLEEIYRYPVEIEFTVNFIEGGAYKINLLQCRPLQTRGLGRKVTIPAQVNKKDALFDSSGYFLGGNISQKFDWVVYIDPQKYLDLSLSDKYEIARIVGKVNRTIKNRDELSALLMGPGRWGTTTPSLGVPVKFAEINNITALAEVAFPEGNLMPELSFGTHFFQDLVETNIFYVALFPQKGGVTFNSGLLKEEKNLFIDLIPEASKYEEVIGVYDVSGHGLRVMSDVISQRVVCFRPGKIDQECDK